MAYPRRDSPNPTALFAPIGKPLLQQNRPVLDVDADLLVVSFLGD
jgi:hypothetical protein